MKYTIGTLVTDWSEYNLMQQSFRLKGFKEDDCEFLTVDNTNGNTMDAFSGNNWILNNAKGEYVILCHQDIRIKFDTRTTLDNRLRKLTEIDPNWALAGNAGGTSPGHRALRTTDPFGYNQNIGGPFPVKAQALDGSFIIVKKDSRLGFSRDLEGFHFYDADICLHADLMGYSVYVIDFHLEHLGQGLLDTVFQKNKETFQRRWQSKLQGRPLQLTTVLIKV